MVTIKVFEGPLCCNTGVCGPDPAQALVDFTADVRWVTELGAAVTRANLAQDPAAFATDDLARAFLQTAGAGALPLVIVDGLTALTGRYPTRAELARYAGIAAADPEQSANRDDGTRAPATGHRDPAPQPLPLVTSSVSCCGNPR
ncbi:arsenite efflux transporter metallochaperone ArsD [Propionicicella superfundia]|uniref:arsenite efflux transporter metallochaperone ArsD n=1 Tax=Propionicicella superfundia TaxID=348582 RepID=UPI000A00E14F|nr:arsenite efflux transporter metallochaperone ArsD [Propionicicella superfundia]